MRIVFLISAFISFIFNVHAQREITQYICQVEHKSSQTAFYMSPDQKREIEVGGWKIVAGMARKNNEIEVSLGRSINVMDVNYQKEAKRKYPRNTRSLPVELHHMFGGVTDSFFMVCHPRDP